MVMNGFIKPNTVQLDKKWRECGFELLCFINWQNNTKIVPIVKNIGQYIIGVRLISEWWAIQGSNLWLSARQADTLPLS